MKKRWGKWLGPLPLINTGKHGNKDKSGFLTLNRARNDETKEKADA